MVPSQTFIKLTVGFLIKVPLWVPDSFQFVFMTFQNQYDKVNNSIMYFDDTTAFLMRDSTDDVVQKLCRDL